MPAEAPTIVAPAPSAPPPAPGAPSAVPRATGEIHVQPPVTKPTATPEPKPESAKGKMFKALEEKSGNTNRPGAKAAPAKPAALEPKEVPKPGEAAPAEPGAAAPAEPAAPAADPKDGKKPSPWKLVEDYKARSAKAEARIAELEKNALPEHDRKSFEERATKAEARAQELEKYLTYVDYSQTEEFKKTYVEPYNKAWQNAMGELKELTVSDGQGGERPVTAHDLLTLVTAPLAKARALAEEHFGSFANDVMAHRNEIKGLFDKQAAALEDAKNNGVEKKKQALEAQTKTQQEMAGFITSTWKSENEAVQADPKYGAFFKPREGDEHWNQRLAKGYELVDKAFSQNPADPSLSKEERQAVVRRHAAVRNRAAAWGALRGEVEALQSQLKSVQDELVQYKGSEPGTIGDGKQPAGAAPPGSGSAKEQMKQALLKRAR